MNKDQEIIRKYKKNNPWGISTHIDLYGCNPKTIKNAIKIKKFVRELCELIEMKRFGETVIINFGENPRVSGYSMTQLIETSLISAHFANQSGAAYLDVFSCKGYPPYKAAKFAKDFFRAKRMEIIVNFRK